MIFFFIVVFIVSVLAVVTVHKLFASEYHRLELIGQATIPILISVAAFYISENVRYYDTEYLGEVTRKAFHEEDYEYWTTCSEEYPCGTDSKGNTEYCIRYYPCCETVPNKYYVETTHNTRSIGRDDYRYIAGKFGNQRIIGSQGDCRSGNIFMAKWDGDTSRFHPFTVKSAYKNKVRFSAVYKTRKLTDKEKVGMLGYPRLKTGRLQEAVIGKGNAQTLGFTSSDFDEANRKLMIFNSVYGEKKREQHGQVRVFVFLYENDTKARNHIHFVGGVNKNELMVVIGPNFYEVYVFDNESVANDIRTILFGRNYTLTQLVGNIIQSAKNKWVRKEFTQLNRIVQVQPSTTTFVVAIIVNIIFNVGLAFFFVKNEYRE